MFVCLCVFCVFVSCACVRDAVNLPDGAVVAELSDVAFRQQQRVPYGINVAYLHSSLAWAAPQDQWMVRRRFAATDARKWGSVRTQVFDNWILSMSRIGEPGEPEERVAAPSCENEKESERSKRKVWQLTTRMVFLAPQATAVRLPEEYDVFFLFFLSSSFSFSLSFFPPSLFESCLRARARSAHTRSI